MSIRHVCNISTQTSKGWTAIERSFPVQNKYPHSRKLEVSDLTDVDRGLGGRSQLPAVLRQEGEGSAAQGEREGGGHERSELRERPAEERGRDCDGC